MDAAEDDHLGLGGGRLARQPERVADEVGDVLDLRHLIVVREDHSLALGDEPADLVMHGADVLDRERWLGGLNGWK